MPKFSALFSCIQEKIRDRNSCPSETIEILLGLGAESGWGDQLVYVATCGMSEVLTVETARNIATAVMGVYMGWRIFSLLVNREHIGQAGADLAKEFAAFFLVFVAIQTYVSSAFGYLQSALSTYDAIIDEAYTRHVKFHQCVANLRLSGPLSAYASYAEAKYAVYGVLYTDAMARIGALAGAVKYALEVGPLLLAFGFLFYAAWLRPVGGLLLGLAVALAVGTVATADYIDNKVLYYKEELKHMDFHPFTATGCDDRLISMYKRDIHGWREVIFVAPLALAAIAAAGAAAGAVLSRH